MSINIIQIPHVDKIIIIIKPAAKVGKNKDTPDAIKLLLKYCGREAFQKKKKKKHKQALYLV